MVKLNNLSNPFPRKKKFRVGRGPGSGSGKNAGYGNKGQKSRSGRGKESWFEGGQTPIYKRLPQLKGFKSRKNRKIMAEINIDTLSEFFKEGDTVDIDTLKDKGIIKERVRFVKILGRGEIDFPLTVKASAFSESAKEKIEKAGGKVEVVR